MTIECYIGINFRGWYGRIIRGEKEDVYCGPYTKRFKEQLRGNIGRVKIEQVYFDFEQQEQLENLILEGKTCQNIPIMFVLEDYQRLKNYTCFKHFNKKVDQYLSGKNHLSLSRQHLSNVAKVALLLPLVGSTSGDIEMLNGTINMAPYLEWVKQNPIVSDLRMDSTCFSPNSTNLTIGSSNEKEELLTIGSSIGDGPYEIIDDDDNIIVFEEVEKEIDNIWQDENPQITIGSSREILNEEMDVRDIKLPDNINDIIIEQYNTNKMIDKAIIKFLLAKRANEYGITDRFTIGVICAIFDVETTHGTSENYRDRFNYGGEVEYTEKTSEGDTIYHYYDRSIEHNGQLDIIASVEKGVDAMIKNIANKHIYGNKNRPFYKEPTSVADVMNNIGRTYAGWHSKYRISSVQVRENDVFDPTIRGYWTLATTPNRDKNGTECAYYEDYIAGMVPDSINELDQFIVDLSKNTPNEKIGKQKVLQK